MSSTIKYLIRDTGLLVSSVFGIAITMNFMDDSNIRELILGVLSIAGFIGLLILFWASIWELHLNDDNH